MNLVKILNIMADLEPLHSFKEDKVASKKQLKKELDSLNIVSGKLSSENSVQDNHKSSSKEAKLTSMEIN